MRIHPLPSRSGAFVALSLPLPDVPQIHGIAHRHLPWLPGGCCDMARRRAYGISFVKGRGAELLPGLRECDWVPSSARDMPPSWAVLTSPSVAGRGPLDGTCMVRGAYTVVRHGRRLATLLRVSAWSNGRVERSVRSRHPGLRSSCRVCKSGPSPGSNFRPFLPARGGDGGDSGRRSWTARRTLYLAGRRGNFAALAVPPSLLRIPPSAIRTPVPVP